MSAAKFTSLNMSVEHRKRVRDGYRELISEQAVNYFITFNFGYMITPSVALDRMKGFCTALERKGLGHQWYKRPARKRLFMIGFPERLDLNPHWHAAARVPHSMVDPLEVHGAELWEKWASRGQLHAEEILDLASVNSYCTKRLHQPAASENVFLYRGRKSKPKAVKY